MFGNGAVDTIFCGTGSGYAFAPYTVNIWQGLVNAGFEVTSGKWLKRFVKSDKKANKEDKTLTKLDKTWSGIKILIDELPIEKSEIEEACTTDTVIYVIRRNAGENNDRKNEKGDYLLSNQETENLKLLSQRFAHIAVILNTCVIDANCLMDNPHIQAVIQMGYGGNEAGNALADVLSGAVPPCGRLTDTWAKRYSDYPASSTFGDNDGDSLQEDYNEDIFVGYRYFDSMGIEPLFPFGYGLGYGMFSHVVVEMKANWKQVVLSVESTNIGKYEDRDVVQIYVSAPQGKLIKPFQELKGFGKTKKLKPGETECIQIIIPTETLASYDEEAASFILEKGKYLFRAGGHSRDTNIVGILTLDKSVSIRKVVNRMKPDHPLDLLLLPKINNGLYDKLAQCNLPKHSVMNSIAEKTPFLLRLDGENVSCIEGYCKQSDNMEIQHSKAQTSTLLDVKSGKVKMEDFVASLDEEVLFRLVTGAANETPYKVPSRLDKGIRVYNVIAPRSSGSTTSLFTKSLGIPAWYLTDGPAGLHLPHCGATSFPVGMVLAQTWDISICETMGLYVGKELKAYNYSVILGPGMNIHRDPLCGRNFEYYSEDPFVSGKIAAATTKGVQSVKGTSVCLKHFACNNQEANRLSTNSTVSERALREIYLRGFEICVREAQPNTIMSSYNKINGIHTSSNYELLTDILRNEWGFKGLVMTDWGTDSEKDRDLCAGNNLIMGGYQTNLLKAALLGSVPEFSDDGYVKSETHAIYGGFFTQTTDTWNTFVPQKDGEDSVTVTVDKEITLNDKVTTMIQEGIAEMDQLQDGRRRITYHGINKGITLNRNILEKNACVVLDQIMKSVSFEKMVR